MGSFAELGNGDFGRVAARHLATSTMSSFGESGHSRAGFGMT